MLVAASTSTHALTTASSSVSWLRRVASPSDLPPLHATCLLSDLKYLLMWKLEEPCATNVLAHHEKSFYQFVQCQLCRSYMDVAVSCELCKVHCIYGFTVPESKGSTLVYKSSDPELNCQVDAHESVNSF